MNTARREWDTELSTIDTALLLAGVLDAKQYFDDRGSHEVQIRSLADRSTSAWTGNGPEEPSNARSAWAGSRRRGVRWLRPVDRLQRGDDPVHPRARLADLPVTSRRPGSTGRRLRVADPATARPTWSSRRSSATSTRTAGSTSVTSRTTTCGPKGIDYFENSRRATSRSVSTASPTHVEPGGIQRHPVGAHRGRRAERLQRARRASGAERRRHHRADGGVGSLAVRARDLIPTIQNLCINYPALWGPYGFQRRFNLARNPDWYGPDFLGIDQGPIVIMIENYRTGRCGTASWQNPYVQAGISAAGLRVHRDVADGVALAPHRSSLERSQSIRREHADRLPTRPLGARAPLGARRDRAGGGAARRWLARGGFRIRRFSAAMDSRAGSIGSPETRAAPAGSHGVRAAVAAQWPPAAANRRSRWRPFATWRARAASRSPPCRACSTTARR